MGAAKQGTDKNKDQPEMVAWNDPSTGTYLILKRGSPVSMQLSTFKKMVFAFKDQLEFAIVEDEDKESE